MDPASSTMPEETQRYAKLTVGVVVFNSGKYLPYCLKSLSEQTMPHFQIVVQDNTEGKSGDAEWIRKNYPSIRVIESENVGFAKGHNNILRETMGLYYLALNPDMIFEPTFIENMMKALEQDKEAVAVSGKIYRWDFEKRDEKDQGKTKVIDTTGLRALKNHRFEDRGQGEEDKGQYDKALDIFGTSGAAALYRRDALEEVAFIHEDGTREYFDELMYMYKEDIDLAYRLQWAGHRAVFAPEAVAYHDRTTQFVGGARSMRNILKSRKKRPRLIREWSYLNHQILLKKHVSQNFSKQTLRKIWWHHALMHVYILTREPYLLKQRKKLKLLANPILERKAQIKKHVTASALEQKLDEE